ncbi:MAG: adenylosuccinate lyase [Thermoprotei archaeon]
MSEHVCVFEWRYGSPEMRRLFSRENVLKSYARVEAALLYALWKVGIAEEEDFKAVSEAVNKIDVNRVDQLEAQLGHDVMALAVHLAELAGDRGRFVHFGATSYDIVDTAYALIVRDALEIVLSKLKKIITILVEYSLRYKDLVMVGRTHGQHADPITLGFKFANYAYELARSYERLKELAKRVVKAKFAGAVGTMAAWGALGLRIQEEVCDFLNLPPHEITTQVAPRDGYAELISDLAILGSQLDRLALEVRELMRPEIMELAEGSATRKVGSSTMPHKANPVTAEKISGLAKVLRGFVFTALENIPLWHERDLTNSSSERVILSHSFLTIDEMLNSTIDLLNNLAIYPENMRRNLELTKGSIMAESLMVRLTLKGLPRHKAHELLMRVARTSQNFREAVMNNEEIRKYLSPKEIEEALDPGKYLGMYDKLIERAIEYVISVTSD